MSTELGPILDDLVDQVGLRSPAHPDGFPATADGQLLGIAHLEEKICVVWEAWRAAKRNLPESGFALEGTLIDLAATAVMMIYGLRKAPQRM